MKTGCNVLKFKLLAIGFCAILSAAVTSNGQIVTLNNGNSSASVNLGSQAGMYSWTVDGVNQLAQQWFWYRIGNASQSSIDTIGGLTFSQPNSYTLFATYHSAQVSVEIDYTLTGGALGSGTAAIGESITVSNSSAASLPLSFFQFSHYTLGGITGGATATEGQNLHGLWYTALENNSSTRFNETDVVPGGNHGEVALSAATLVGELNGPAYTLNGNPSAGPGDVGFAFEWDSTLAPGGTLLISKNKYISPVPEPGAIALLGLGFVAFMWRKRQ